MPGFVENPSDIINRSKQNQSMANSTLRFPTTDIPYKMLMNFVSYDYQSYGLGNNSYTNKVNGGTVILPLPLQLNDITGVEAGQASVGLLGAAIIEAFNSVSSMGSSSGPAGSGTAGILDSVYKMKNMLSQNFGSDVEAIFNNPGATTLGVAAEFATLGGTTTASVLQGRAANPYDTVKFSGVKLKTHNFNWRLSPANLEESEVIKNIIRTIKNKSLPTYASTTVGGNTQTGAHAMLNYPNLAMISFLGINQDYYYKLKPSMITNVTVRYNSGDQLNVFKGGKPVIVELGIELSEVNIHTSADYPLQ